MPLVFRTQSNSGARQLIPAESRAEIGSVSEMSQQSNFRNHAVVERAGEHYRPNRHGGPRDTQITNLAPASLPGFFLIGRARRTPPDGNRQMWCYLGSLGQSIVGCSTKGR